MQGDLTDNELPGYAVLHCQTEVAAFHKNHVVRLLRLAGMNGEADECEAGNREWFYLGPRIILPIVERIEQPLPDTEGR